MTNSIIEVNNLSKSYTISYEGRERYTSFPKRSGQVRDVMAQKAKKVFSFPGWKLQTSLYGKGNLSYTITIL